MKIALRADASRTIGSGHVMRCLTLADELAAAGAEIRFVTRELPGHLASFIAARGHACELLPAPDLGDSPDADGPAHGLWLGLSRQRDAAETSAALVDWGKADWLVVDHYALDGPWEHLLRQQCEAILAIDDLADRPHDADLLLDQNLQEREGRYRNCVTAGCRILSGPAYALLRPEFRVARRSLRPRYGQVRRINVFFGGGDAENLTGLALAALARLGRADIAADVVVGAAHPKRGEIEATCATMANIRCHWNVSNMAELLAAADLALGAAGSSTWERACLGLPALVVTVADNQRPIARAADAAGLFTWLGDAACLNEVRLAEAIDRAIAAPAQRLAQGERGLALVDGEGAWRVAEVIQT